MAVKPLQMPPVNECPHQSSVKVSWMDFIVGLRVEEGRCCLSSLRLVKDGYDGNEYGSSNHTHCEYDRRGDLEFLHKYCAGASWGFQVGIC